MEREFRKMLVLKNAFPNGTFSNGNYSYLLAWSYSILQYPRALVRTGATGAWAPINFEQRVPGTRQFLMFNLIMRLILVKLVKKFGNFSFANNCAPVN